MLREESFPIFTRGSLSLVSETRGSFPYSLVSQDSSLGAIFFFSVFIERSGFALSLRLAFLILYSRNISSRPRMAG